MQWTSFPAASSWGGKGPHGTKSSVRVGQIVFAIRMMITTRSPLLFSLLLLQIKRRATRPLVGRSWEKRLRWKRQACSASEAGSTRACPPKPVVRIYGGVCLEFGSGLVLCIPPSDPRDDYAAAISRVTRIGSLSTLHNAVRFSSRGRTRSDSHRETAEGLTPICSARSVAVRPRRRRASRMNLLKLGLRAN